MKNRAVKIAGTVADTGVSLVVTVIGLALRTIGAIILIAVTTGIMFSCIFVMYVKTNLSAGLDVKLNDFTMSLSSIMYYIDADSGNSHEMVTLQSQQYRRWVEYDELSTGRKNIEHALVAIEDKRFYEHNGVDWYRTVAAFGNMFSDKDTFGGSTITQQLIKNLTADNEATVTRKLTEIFRALEFEKNYNKEEIIEWYLNIVYFGNHCYGIGAAANYYFGKDVEDLTLAECASIIGITNNPSLYNPYANSERNKVRQETILDQMYKEGYISESECDRAVAEKLVFKRGADSVYTEEIYTWFEEAVIDDVLNDLIREKDISRITAQNMLYNGGYRIYTTWDPRIQAAIDEVYLDVENLPAVTGSAQQLQSAMIIADPYTGDILGLTGGVGEKTKNLLYNRATVSRRPPGSSIKPLSVYSPAMDAGLISPDTRFDDGADVVLKGTDWMPNNDDLDYRGIMTIREGIIRSRNTIAAQVLDLLTPAVSYRFMRDVLGFDLNEFDADYAPLSLGELTYGATVREMASAYTMFPNGGVRSELRTYTSIFDSDGVLVYEKKISQIHAIKEQTAYAMTDILHAAAVGGTGSEANLGDVPTAGKTGTTSSSKDRWFAGFTPRYTAICWTGYDRPEVIKMKARGNPASQIWKRVMTIAHEGQEPGVFNIPQNTYLPPVQGVEEVSYTVRYLSSAGNIIYEENLSGKVGSEITVTAPQIEEYMVTGDESVTRTLNVNPARNIIEFTYVKLDPETGLPEETEPTDDPNAGETGEPYDPNESDGSWLFPPSPSGNPGVSLYPGGETTPPDYIPPGYTPAPPLNPSDYPSTSTSPSPTQTPALPVVPLQPGEERPVEEPG